MTKTASQLIWEDPPAPKLGRPPGGGVWLRLLSPLLDRPGEWARVEVCETSGRARNKVSRFRNGAVRVPPGAWEFTARKMPDGKGAIYARYLGPVAA